MPPPPSSVVQDLGHVHLGSAGLPLRILQLTDLHHFPVDSECFHTGKGVKSGKPLKDLKPGAEEPERIVYFDHVKGGGDTDYSITGDVMLAKQLLFSVKPHLVLLTGDILDGRPFGKDASNSRNGDDKASMWIDAMCEVLKPIQDAGVPWSFVPGNHDDDDSPWERNDLLAIYSLPGCIAPSATSFNHTLTIGPTAQPDATSIRLWLLDTGGNHPTLRYDPVDPAVVEDVRRLAAQYTQSQAPRLLQLAYFHIPLNEYANLDPVVGQNGLFDAALHAGMVPKPFCYIPWLVRLLGKHRVVGCSQKNTGLFTELAQAGVLAMFCGHDHYNDACMVHPGTGIYCCYGRVGAHTPPGDWEGDGGPMPFPLGARVVQITSTTAAATATATATAARTSIVEEAEDGVGEQQGGKGGEKGEKGADSDSHPSSHHRGDRNVQIKAETWVQEAGGRAERSHLVFKTQEEGGIGPTAVVKEPMTRQEMLHWISAVVVLLAWLFVCWQKSTKAIEPSESVESIEGEL